MPSIKTTQFVGPNDNAMFTGYQHAYKLYLSDNYKNVPKMAHMYFVKFNVNEGVSKLLTNDWDPNFTALLAKSVNLPKFKIQTETLNQYNRKTNIQTKITYEPVTIEMHDDRGSSTTNFWQNYYKYYYADSRYNDPSSNQRLTDAYGDTKYSNTSYRYGFDPNTNTTYGYGEPYFLKSIDIFLLHQSGPNVSTGDFTKITLINPLISSWDHDQVTQEGNKIMANKMTLVYEDVVYQRGKITDAESGVQLFEDTSVYDVTETPIKLLSKDPVNVAQNDYVGKTLAGVPTSDRYRQQEKNSISIGQVLSTVNKLKLLIQQPRQAWNVYGVNIKNLLVGAAIGNISATQINLTAPSTTTVPQQGTVTKVTTFGTQGQETV